MRLEHRSSDFARAMQRREGAGDRPRMRLSLRPRTARVEGMISSSLVRRAALLIALILAMLAGFASACTPVRHVLITADPLALGPEAQPDLFEGLAGSEAERLAAWNGRRPDLLATLDSTLYGAAPAEPASVVLGDWRPVPETDQPGDRALSTVTIQTSSGDSASLTLALVSPARSSAIRGVVLVPTECGLQAALHDPSMPAPTGFTPGYCNADGWLSDLLGGFFGEWIAGPPAERLLEQGYAIAAWHESDLAPDSAALHAESLARLGLDPDADDRPGVISLWAWTISRAIDALRQEPRLSDVPVIAYGHSRRGKAVLLAAARDERIAVTVSHQSGTAGAALQNDAVGEPIRSITQTYPHWFAPGYQRFADPNLDPPLDQHALLALIAPRAVLLGAAWRDSWADPAGAFRAAEAASPAWALYGRPGLVQTRMADFQPSGGLASHIRPGTHGVTDEDWTAFLAFMDAHTAAPDG